MTGPDPAPLLLDSERVDELHRLLGTVEDWLLHTCDETLDDLGRFLAGQAWSGGPPERLASALVADLGEHSVALARALRTADNSCGQAT
jgi:hypothetical protein